MIVSREIGFRAFHSHHGMLSEPHHPHDFKVILSVKGDPNEEGFVVDYRALKRTFNRVIGAELEGKDLDKIFEYPTSENLAVWIWSKMSRFYPLYCVKVFEKPHSRASYYGPR